MCVYIIFVIIFRLLAHLYAAECLVLVDKISEAIEHLNPLKIKGISLEPPTDDGILDEEKLIKTSPPSSNR